MRLLRVLQPGNGFAGQLRIAGLCSFSICLCLAFRAAFWSVIALMGLLQTSADKEADKKLLPLLGVQA